MIIKLKEFLDTCILIAPEKAKKVREVILERIREKKEVILDFSEIRTVTLAFLFYLFEGVKKEFRKKDLPLLQIKNPTKSLYEEIDYLKENYKILGRKFKRIEKNLKTDN